MPKDHVLINSEYLPGKASDYMYESDDFRVEKNDPTLRKGTFQHTRSVKGEFNSHEIGIFTCEDGTEYLIFHDYSAKLRTSKTNSHASI
jgi:hypothetical protein